MRVRKQGLLLFLTFKSEEYIKTMFKYITSCISPAVRENPLMLRIKKQWNRLPVRHSPSAEVLKEKEMSGKTGIFAGPQNVPSNPIFL